MKILITGLNGYLGKNLLKFINKKKYKLLSIQRKKSKINYPKNIKVIWDNIGNLKPENVRKIEKFKPNILLNLAWHGIPNFSYKNSLYNINIHLSFLKIVLKLKSIKKIIMTGSCWEYKDNIGKCEENSKLLSNSNFAWSKRTIYSYLKSKCLAKKIDFVWFRIFFMYGPFQKKKSLIPYIYNSLKKLKKPKILYPNNQNDFIYVDDVCSALIKSFSNNFSNKILNLGSGKLTSVYEIYSTMLKVLNFKNKRYHLSKIKNKKKVKYNYASTKKVHKNLKWNAKISLIKGIRNTISV